MKNSGSIASSFGMSMLLAAALPLSTGAHSYTAPFLCQVFDRGRAQTRLGMIDSMSITRGKNNLAFNQIGEPMSVEVQFSVVELSSVLHMPIQQEFKVLDVGQIFERESLYNDYIAVLSSLSLAEQIYVGERIKIGLTKYLKNMDSYFSVAHAMNWVGDMGAVRVFSMFFDGIANR
jgi:CTP synthase (UTP-ammonia lyase)